jgi:hypothetical protein
MTRTHVSNELQQKYLFKLYRFATLPNKIPKGRHYFQVAQHHLGKKKEEIIKSVGGEKRNFALNFFESLTPAGTSASLENVIKGYESGVGIDPDTFISKKLSDQDVCKLFGALRKYIK